MFHENSGDNVSLNMQMTTATWSPVVTGGCAFPKLPLAPSQQIALTLDGSGAVELSVMADNPARLSHAPPNTSAQIHGNISLNEIKLHKRECHMKVSIDSSGTEVTSSTGGGQYVQPVPGGRTYWLVIDVKYGDVEVKIENQGNENNRNEFLSVHGRNIQVMNDTSVIRSKHKSPASVCILKSPLKIGHRLVFHCKPQSYQGTTPGRYNVTAKLSKADPIQCKTKFPAEFQISVKDDKVPEFIEVECFEKEECTGDLVLDVYDDKIAYTSATGKVNKHPYPVRSTKPTWLLLSLYGVSVTAECMDIPETFGCAQAKLKETKSEAKNKKGNRNQDYLMVSNARADRRAGASQIGAAEDVEHVVEARKLRKSLDDNTDAVQLLYKRLNSEEETVQEVGLDRRLLPPIPQVGAIAEGGQTNIKTEKTEENMVMLERAIRDNFVSLTKSLHLGELLDYLYEAKLITLAELQDIGKLSETHSNRAIRDVLTLLSQRPVCKKVFINALEKTGQKFLLPIFFPDDYKE